MKTPAAIALSAACLLAACSAATRTTTVESGGDVTSSAAVTPTSNMALPTGAVLSATLDQALGTGISHAGDAFYATVSNTLYASDGSIVVPAGAKIMGRVTALNASNNAADPALIRLDFQSLQMNGRTYPLAAQLISAPAAERTTSSMSNAEKTKQIVIGGAVGAAIGGLLSKGELDKIVIGGAIGAAAGSVVSLGNTVNATLPAGSQMTVQTTAVTQLR
jgi:hypothetical protein